MQKDYIVTSISLPTPLNDKLKLFMRSNNRDNLSQMIKFILEDFFAGQGHNDMFPELDDQDFLVPVDLYAKSIGLGKTALNSRINKGELKLVRVYDQEYIKADKGDLKNVFAQLLATKNKVTELEQMMMKYIEETQKLSKEIQALQKQDEN